jgi:hypothetical protein
VLRIKHATDMSDSKLLISHHLVAVALKAAQIDSTCSVRIRPRIVRCSGSARRVGGRAWASKAVATGRSNFKGQLDTNWAVRYGANCEVAASDRLWAN